MLVSLELNFGSNTCNTVIGISPIISSETSQVEDHIIEGAHPELKAMNFSKENMDWCCGNELSFDKITYGFSFVPGWNRECEMFNDDSGYHLVPRTAVCLPNSMKKRKKGGNKKSDATYERMLVLTVSNKGRGEYAKIWKKLMEDFKNKKFTNN